MHWKYKNLNILKSVNCLKAAQPLQGDRLLLTTEGWKGEATLEPPTAF